MGTLTHVTGAFITSLSLIGVSIYFFIEGDDTLGRLFIFLAIYTFVTLFYIIRSLFYLKHKATFNEFIFVFILPIVPILMLVSEMYLVSPGSFSTNWVVYTYEVKIIDILLLPYYLFSTFLLFRTFIRYPFIRFKSTSEKGMPPKLAGILLMLIIPTIYIVLSTTYFDNLFLLIAGIVYLYSAVMALFV